MPNKQKRPKRDSIFEAIHPDPEIARELLAMGIYRLRTRGGHAGYGQCGAWARTTEAPCMAPAVKPGGRCRRHGGSSTGPRTPEGKERARTAPLRHWAQWRMDHGYPPESWRERRAEAREQR
jgi:hypothetical protein